MFEGFAPFDIDVGPVRLTGVSGGSGPPLLLLHGYPQTHVMWHRVAPDLARDFTVVVADLRGYGGSSKPPGGGDHSAYSKREMAADMVRLMTEFGHNRFQVLAHDRGARVAHRMALDHGDVVERLMLLDIAPTREMYRDATDGFARAYWHWFFLIRPAPMPERMIGADPEAFWRWKCSGLTGSLDVFAPEAITAYVAAFSDPAAIAASCEDYRAAASIDIAHDDADGGRKIACPLHVLWGDKGAIEAHFDCLALWRERADTVTGRSVPSGHYIPEENPEAVIAEARAFFA